MAYYGNSTTGADHGQDISYDESDGWECPYCGHIFWVASAWSEDDGATGGMLCPECDEFISNDELGIDEN